jgi:hypothetical protein
MKNLHSLGIAIATLLLLISLTAAAIVARVYVFPPQPTKPAASDNPVDTIKVGILLSAFTANGPHWQRQPYGYAPQVRIISALQDPSLRLIPVIEPHTADHEELARILSLYFPMEAPLDASSVDDLKQLDVLVAPGQPDMTASVLASIDESVTNGLGLLQHGLGFVSPGFTPQIERLTGVANGIRGWSPNPIPADIVGAHPLLGDLSGQFGKKIDLIANGTLGILNGTPLIRVTNSQQVRAMNPSHPRTPDEFLDALYIAQLGKGKIVGIGFSIMRDAPDALEAANQNRFYIHCVEWLAGKPLN